MRQRNILWIRADSIGDNILASSMLPEIRKRYPDHAITVLCQRQVAELYEHCPEIDDVITFDKETAYTNDGYRSNLIEKLCLLKPDIALNPTFSREPLTDILTIGSMATERIAFNGDFANGMTLQLRQTNNPLYTKLIYTCCQQRTEMDRHREFLRGLGIVTTEDALKPLLWLHPEDEAFANGFFEENALRPQETIALFPWAKNHHNIYTGYAQVLDHFKGYHCVIVGGRDASDAARAIKAELPDCHDLTGKTTIRQSAAIIGKSRIYLGADSSGAHMASALGIANVVVLGGGHFGRFIPYSALTTAVCLPLECYGCNWNCPYPLTYCVRDVSPEAVVQAVNIALSTADGQQTRIVVDSTQCKGSTHMQRTSQVKPRWRWSDSYLTLKDVEVIRYPADSPSHKVRGSQGQESPLVSVGGGPPLVSVLVSTYNSEEFMRECLQDLQGQTIARNMEVIVVDAASPQDERAIVQEYQRMYTNITYVRTGTRIGVYAAWNIAIAIARGQYITTFSTNDRLRRDAFEILADYLNDTPNCMLVYGDSYLTEIPHQSFDAHHCHDVYRWPEFRYEDLLYNCMIGPHPMWRRSVHDDIGYFDARYESLGDQDFWLRLGARYEIHHLPEVTGLYWVTPDALSCKGQLPPQEHLEIRLHYQQLYIDSLKKTVTVNNLFDKRPLYIWGAGQAGETTLNMLLNSGIPVDGFIDSDPNKWDKRLVGLPIRKSSHIQGLVQANRRPFIVIASMYARQIRPFLIDLGLKDRQDFWTNIHTFWALKGLAEKRI
ncbi:Glycosyl transferase, family 2 domain protein [Candidatus Magnetobacterium bavaricum]|uniref:Glycosyl transferase, family 2 domain protein n=1 Tax=Candidatus Magnetobacterium bavaricum TaxID=29290 RepID=A0A0F3GNT9_9BACT|nr:Glycosyl transferase, family 2 domain protein [Candidatus Magnetobacterium bavaricum]